MQPGPKGLPTASVGRASHAPPARRRGQPREVCLGQRDPPRYSLCIRRPPCYPRVTTAGTRLSRNSTQKLMADTPAEAKKKAEQLRQATDVSRQRRTRNSLRAFETDEISDYLTRPIRNGYWKLVPARKSNGKFLTYLAEANGIAPADLVTSNSRKAADDEKVVNLKKLTTSIRALAGAHLFKVNGELTPVLRAENSIDDEGIFDAAAVLAKFPTLVEIFGRTIYFADFVALVSVGTIFRTSRGYSILLENWSSEAAIFASMKREPLDDLASLLLEAELASSCTVERVFSPEEDLFRPYFDFLQLVYDSIIKDERVKGGFVSAFDYFKKQDFTHCISTLGLVAEDYLAQVYEYYLRNSCPKGNTLGQIYDQLHAHIRNLINPAAPKVGDSESLYQGIAAFAKHSDTSIPEYKTALDSLLRDIVSLIKADRRYVAHRLDEIVKPSKRVSVFPDVIHENLMELIRNRNAASHKTRVPIGAFEALRTLYCLTAFVLWWHTTRSNTDWGKPMEQIVKEAVSAATV